ncbi:hypothetical protein BHE74_00012579 [Ensete ventricosum]|nr:hypothetical protein BHE74_00012579 [Ensete ventricosum]
MKLGLAVLRISAAPPPTSAREGGGPLLLLFPSSRIFHCESSSLSLFSSRSPFRPLVARLATSFESSQRNSIHSGSNEDEEEEGDPYLTSSNPSASLLSLSEKPDRSLALLDEYELEELDPDRSTCHNHRSAVRPRTSRYVPVCQLIGMRIARYRAVLPKSIVGGRLREKEKGEEEEGGEEEGEKYLARSVARGRSDPSPMGNSSPAGDFFSTCGEKE